MPHCAAVAVSLLVIASAPLAGGSNYGVAPWSRNSSPEDFRMAGADAEIRARPGPRPRRQYLHHGDAGRPHRAFRYEVAQIQRMGPSLRRASARPRRRQGGQGLVHGQRQRHHRRARSRDRQGAGAQGALGREPAYAGARRVGRDLVYQPVRLRRQARSLEWKKSRSTGCRGTVRTYARQARQRLGVPQ